MRTFLEAGKTFDAEHAALQQVGWLGHNDNEFYHLYEEESCKLNNTGGWSPVYRQVGTYKRYETGEKYLSE